MDVSSIYIVKSCIQWTSSSTEMYVHICIYAHTYIDIDIQKLCKLCIDSCDMQLCLPMHAKSFLTVALFEDLPGCSCLALLKACILPMANSCA